VRFDGLFGSLEEKYDVYGTIIMVVLIWVCVALVCGGFCLWKEYRKAKTRLHSVIQQAREEGVIVKPEEQIAPENNQPQPNKYVEMNEERAPD